MRGPSAARPIPIHRAVPTLLPPPRTRLHQFLFNPSPDTSPPPHDLVPSPLTRKDPNLQGCTWDDAPAVMVGRRCPGAAVHDARWTAGSLVGAFLDLALVHAFLCAAAVATAAAGLLALVGVSLPCTCARPHLPCILGFLFTYPSQVLDSLLRSLRARFPFARDDAAAEEGEEEEELGEGSDEYDLRREIDDQRGARAGLQQELEKERSAAASAAEEAMAMILRLQKEKSALEIELRQNRRTSDERCAFFEDEVEELRDILLMRERETRGMQKEMEGYRRLLGLTTEEDEEEEEMLTPDNGFLEGEPCSSKSGDNNDSMFSFRTPFTSGRDDFLSHMNASPDHVRDGASADGLAVKTLGKLPVVEPRLDTDSCGEDDGAETVVILPLSARSLEPPLSARSFDQGGDLQFRAAAAVEAVQEMPAYEFQEGRHGGVENTSQDPVGSENDANIYDVHVVDDMCLSAEVKGLIGRSFSDAIMQKEKLQNRVAVDDLLGKTLNAIKRGQDKIRTASSERRVSLQLQLLEDIANQIQEIKDTADAGGNSLCTSLLNPMKS